MKFFIILFFIVYIVLPCATEEMVTISKVYIERKIDNNGKFIIGERIEKENISINIEQIVFNYPLRTEIDRIEGIEELRNMKRMFIGNGLYNISFLEKLKELEILIFDSPSVVIDLEVIKNLPKLRILYINDIEIVKEELDFQSNKQIEFLYLANIVSSKRRGLFELSIKNTPDSMKYIDLSMSNSVIINKKLIDNFVNANCVILYKEPYFNFLSQIKIDSIYLKSHPNIKLYEDKKKDVKDNSSQSEFSMWVAKMLPEKYQRKHIYALLGLDIHGRAITTGEN